MREPFKKTHHAFCNYVEVKGYRTGKGEMYQAVVKDFFSFQIQRAKKDINFTQADVIAYYEHIRTRPNKRGSGTLAESTINHHLFALRLLFDYLLAADYLKAAPLLPKYLRNGIPDMDVLSVEEIKLLYKVAQNELETAILSVAYGAGLRRAEIEALNIKDVLLRDSLLIVQQGKNSKRREVPLSDKVVLDLKNYLHNYRTLKSKDRQAFFISERGTRMAGNTLNRKVKLMVLRTAIDKAVTLHTLRRSIATHLADNGAEIYFIRDFLGHSLIDTTHLYAIKRKRQITL